MTDNDPEGHYASLGLKPSASVKDIENAFRKRFTEVRFGNQKTDTFSAVQQLNHAYSILSDPYTRAQYDAAANITDNDADKLKLVTCNHCLRATDQPRHTVFYRTYSYIYFSVKRAYADVLCPSCAQKEARNSSFITSIFGWWTPFGILRSLQSLRTNINGGEQDKEVNSSLLLQNAKAYLDHGNDQRAYDLLKHSQQMTGETNSEDRNTLLSRLQNKNLIEIDLNANDPWKPTPLGRVSQYFAAFIAPVGAVAILLIFPNIWRENPNLYAPAPNADMVEPSQFRSSSNANSCQTPPANGTILSSRAAPTIAPHSLIIKNGAGDDAIVKIGVARYQPSAFSIFVGRNQSATITGIPDGDYIIQYQFGQDLNASCREFIEPKITARFKRTVQYQSVVGPDGIAVTSYTLPLYRSEGEERTREVIEGNTDLFLDL